MLNRSASLAMSTSVLKAKPGKLDIKRHLVFSMSMVFFIIHLKFDINIPWVDPENFNKWGPDNFYPPPIALWKIPLVWKVLIYSTK